MILVWEKFEGKASEPNPPIPGSNPHLASLATDTSLFLTWFSQDDRRLIATSPDPRSFKNSFADHYSLSNNAPQKVKVRALSGYERPKGAEKTVTGSQNRPRPSGVPFPASASSTLTNGEARCKMTKKSCSLQEHKGTGERQILQRLNCMTTDITHMRLRCCHFMPHYQPDCRNSVDRRCCSVETFQKTF